MERSTQGAEAGAWILSDGRAGNQRQARALAAAMAVDARDWVLAPRAPWRWWAPRRLPGAHAAFGDSFATAMRKPPGLAIGCGRQAALATRLLRSQGTRVVQILDPRLPPSSWDVVVAPAHDALRGANVVSLLGSLHPVDDAWLAQAQAGFAPFGALPGPRFGVLLGGPTAHAPYDVPALDAWLERIGAQVARERGSLLLVASRRTPDAMRALLRDRGAPAHGFHWLDAADGPNPYAGVLAWADRIICTPDSVNMVSEACATRAPVFVAAPDRVRGRVRSFLDALQARGRLRALDDAMAPFDAEPLRETARVAAEVRERLAL